MGSRLLQRYLHAPITDHYELNHRQKAIASLIENGNEKVADTLKRIGDIERIMARLALRSARPRDFSRLRNAFNEFPDLLAQLETFSNPLLSSLGKAIGTYPELQELLNKAIVDNPPVVIRDGGVIAEGFNEELDELRKLSQGATDYLDALEQRSVNALVFLH